MDNYSSKTSVQQPEHIIYASDFVAQIIERFDYTQQNEILKQIRSEVIEMRKSAIEETAKKLDFIKSTLNDI